MVKKKKNIKKSKKIESLNQNSKIALVIGVIALILGISFFSITFLSPFSIAPNINPDESSNGNILISSGNQNITFHAFDSDSYIRINITEFKLYRLNCENLTESEIEDKKFTISLYSIQNETINNESYNTMNIVYLLLNNSIYLVELKMNGYSKFVSFVINEKNMMYCFMNKIETIVETQIIYINETFYINQTIELPLVRNITIKVFDSIGNSINCSYLRIYRLNYTNLTESEFTALKYNISNYELQNETFNVNTFNSTAFEYQMYVNCSYIIEIISEGYQQYRNFMNPIDNEVVCFLNQATEEELNWLSWWMDFFRLIFGF